MRPHWHQRAQWQQRRNYLLYVSRSVITHVESTLHSTGKKKSDSGDHGRGHINQRCRYHSTGTSLSYPCCQIDPGHLKFIQRDVQEGQWECSSTGTAGKGSGVRCAGDASSWTPAERRSIRHFTPLAVYSLSSYPLPPPPPPPPIHRSLDHSVNFLNPGRAASLSIRPTLSSPFLT